MNCRLHRCRVHTARDRLQVGRGVDIENVGIVLNVGLSVINRIVDVVGRVLQLIRAVRAGSLIKHIEQAVEHGLCAGIRVAANRTQRAVDRVEQLVGGGERFGSGVDQLGALVDGGRGDRGQLVERLGQCRNLGQLLADAASVVLASSVSFLPSAVKS